MVQRRTAMSQEARASGLGQRVTLRIRPERSQHGPQLSRVLHASQHPKRPQESLLMTLVLYMRAMYDDPTRLHRLEQIVATNGRERSAAEDQICKSVHGCELPHRVDDHDLRLGGPLRA